MFWKANATGTSAMIVDALIVTSRNFKSIFVSQRFHVPPCAPSVQTFEICKQLLYFFATSFTQKSSTVLLVWVAANINRPKPLKVKLIFNQISYPRNQGGACRFGLKSRQTLG